MAEFIIRREAITADIKPVPAADVVEVVRCKDCGWWNEDDSAGWGHLGNNVCACAYFSNEDGYTVFTQPDDYCSRGEREEDEG